MSYGALQLLAVQRAGVRELVVTDARGQVGAYQAVVRAPGARPDIVAVRLKPVFQVGGNGDPLRLEPLLFLCRRQRLEVVLRFSLGLSERSVLLGGFAGRRVGADRDAGVVAYVGAARFAGEGAVENRAFAVARLRAIP